MLFVMLKWYSENFNFGKLWYSKINYYEIGLKKNIGVYIWIILFIYLEYYIRIIGKIFLKDYIR